MTLEKYLGDREVWQNNTIEEIRKKVIYKSNRPIPIKKNNEGEKLIAIYGPPQIGKTTLILRLLGIDPQFQKQVYNDIRAGIPKGNSSTSTAIIYQQIDADCYGVKYGEGLTNIELCTETELKEKIREIRANVENDSASKDILHIYIPKKYFKRDMEAGLNFVDLPGDGSRNIKEKSHVDAMINKCMALANVNIIACKANEIQSLETLQLPINVDWKNLPHKYIVVITSAFGLGTIRKYFQRKRVQKFYDFVKQSYRQDICKIMGSLSQIESFPIDIGDSYEQVINWCDSNKENQDAVKDTAESIITEIRDSIYRRRGNGLKSTILDLKAYSTGYAQKRCEELKEKIEYLEDEKRRLQREFENKTKRVEECKRKIDELQSYCDKYNQLQLMIYAVTVNAQTIEEKFEHVVMNFSRKGKIKDSEHKILLEIRKLLVELIGYTFEKCDLVHNDTEDEVLYENINMDIDLEATVGDILYKGGWFKKKIKQEEIVDLIYDLVADFCVQLKKHVLDVLNAKICEIKSYCDDYERYRQWKIELARDIAKNRERVEQIEKKLQKLNSDFDAIDSRAKADKKIIDDYLRIADIEFYKYKCNLLERIDSEKCSVEEKAMILIYLCILEKDYQSITEMG